MSVKLPASFDLHQRVIAATKGGMSCSQAADRFGAMVEPPVSAQMNEWTALTFLIQGCLPAAEAIYSTSFISAT